MSLKIDYSNMMSENINNGISEAMLEDAVKIADDAFFAVQNNRGKGMMGWTELPFNQDKIVGDICEFAEKIRRDCEYFVVLGIGGSALGPIAVFNALKHPFYNELSREKRNAPRFYCIDNVDPEHLNALFDIVELDKTVFNVITKSGSTSETMSQYLIISDMLNKAFGEKASEHIIATTSENSGNLIKLARSNGYKTFFIPDSVGGRFSELSPVGLLPAAVLGIDIRKMLDGARNMDKICKNIDLLKNPALLCAALQYISISRGKNISVMMPYAYSLRTVSDWYCQLWGESLGKATDKFGKTVNVGQTPVKALGVTDQHSQVQLYVEGPFDKVVTFIRVKNFRGSRVIPDGCRDFPNVNFLCGHELGELTNTELRATELALKAANRPNFSIEIDGVCEYSLGGLLYFFQMQTAFLGEMLNVDTFNQPGVEGGKNATYALMNRAGYEQKAAEIKAENAKTKKYYV